MKTALHRSTCLRLSHVKGPLFLVSAAKKRNSKLFGFLHIFYYSAKKCGCSER